MPWKSLEVWCSRQERHLLLPGDRVEGHAKWQGTVRKGKVTLDGK